MLKFIGKKRKRQLLRSLSSDPLSEGHPVYRDTFLCLNNPASGGGTEGAAISLPIHICGSPDPAAVP